MSSYEDDLRAWAVATGSDGCTGVPDFFRACCDAHDYKYTLGETPRGVKVTKAEADQQFRDCIQARSRLRFLSPLSWWRWLAVRQFGRGVWQQTVASEQQKVARSVMGTGVTEAQAARLAILEVLRGGI